LGKRIGSKTTSFVVSLDTSIGVPLGFEVILGDCESAVSFSDDELGF
jgi:hypothetical protein